MCTERKARLGDVLVCKVGTKEHEGDEHEEGAVESNKRRKAMKRVSNCILAGKF